MGGGKLRPNGAKKPPKRQLPRQNNAPTKPSSSSQGPAVTKDGLPINWPSEVKYLASPSYSKCVTVSQLDMIRKPPLPPGSESTASSSSSLPAVTGENDLIPLNFPVGPSPSVQIHRITDPSHPACGQCGLFAARDLLPGELILPYYGVVHPGTGAGAGAGAGTSGTSGTTGTDSESDLKRQTAKEASGVGCDASSSSSNSTLDASGGHGNGHVEGEEQPELEKKVQVLSLSSGHGGPDKKAGADEATEDGDMKEKGKERIQHEKSDYDLWLSREADLAVDAEMMGNEARFVNDYRGVPGKERANAEVRLVWDERIVHSYPPPGQQSEESGTGPGENTGRGEWTMAVYVLPLSKKARLKMLEAQAQALERQKKKQGAAKKAPAGGGLVPATTKMSSVGVIKKGEEILVSYGRGFWERRKTEGP